MAMCKIYNYQYKCMIRLLFGKVHRVPHHKLYTFSLNIQHRQNQNSFIDVE